MRSALRGTVREYESVQPSLPGLALLHPRPGTGTPLLAGSQLRSAYLAIFIHRESGWSASAQPSTASIPHGVPASRKQRRVLRSAVILRPTGRTIRTQTSFSRCSRRASHSSLVKIWGPTSMRRGSMLNTETGVHGLPVRVRRPRLFSSDATSVIE